MKIHLMMMRMMMFMRFILNKVHEIINKFVRDLNANAISKTTHTHTHIFLMLLIVVANTHVFMQILGKKYAVILNSFPKVRLPA